MLYAGTFYKSSTHNWHLILKILQKYANKTSDLKLYNLLLFIFYILNFLIFIFISFTFLILKIRSNRLFFRIRLYYNTIITYNVYRIDIDIKNKIKRKRTVLFLILLTKSVFRFSKLKTNILKLIQILFEFSKTGPSLQFLQK